MQVIQVVGGWAIAHLTHTGQMEYLGRDGYWARFAHHVMPFLSRVSANDRQDWEVDN